MVFAWHGLGRSSAFEVQIQIQKYKLCLPGMGWVGLVLLECKYKYRNTKLCLPGMDWEGLVLLECRGSPSTAIPAPRKGLRTL